MSKTENVCQNCHWYKDDRDYSHSIRCINLDRDNWKGIEPKNTCKDFCKNGEYVPTGMWALVAGLVKEVEKVIDEPRFLLDGDSICYGCRYYIGGEEGCNTSNTCIEGSMNDYGIED